MDKAQAHWVHFLCKLCPNLAKGPSYVEIQQEPVGSVSAQLSVVRGQTLLTVFPQGRQ